MSWCVGKSSSSSLRYLSIRSRNSLAQAIVMRLPVAILVAATRLQKFLKSWFSQLSGGRRPHRRPKVTTRCTVQNTRHPSADILPWLFSPIRGGAGEHQEGNVVFSMSSQISWSLDLPRTRVLLWLPLARFANEKRTWSGIMSLWESSIIPSVCLYLGMLFKRAHRQMIAHAPLSLELLSTFFSSTFGLYSS